MFRHSERVPAPAQITNFYSDQVDIRLHLTGNLSDTIAAIDILQDLIVWQRNLSGKQISFEFHSVAGHVEQLKFLKLLCLFTVQAIVADLMQQDNSAHALIKIFFDKYESVSFDYLINAFLTFKRNVFYNDTELTGNLFRIAAAGLFDQLVSSGYDLIGCVQGQRLHLLFMEQTNYKRVNHFSRGIDLATLSLTQAVRQP